MANLSGRLSGISSISGSVNGISAAAAAALAREYAENAYEASQHYPVIIDGYWYLWDVDNQQFVNTNIAAQGPQGVQGETGPQGIQGETGNGIASIGETSATGLRRTFTITYTDGTTTTFDVMNGRGISSISKTGTSGLIDTYTITYNDGTTSTFTVTNASNSANDIEYDDAETYDAGSIGKSVSDLKSAIAHAYDATKTYHEGQFVFYDGKVYVCNQNIDTAEAWTAAHWTQVWLGDELQQLHASVHVLELLEKSRSFTPAQIEEICKDGVADEYFSIGDIILIPYTDNTPATPVTYSVPHVVVHFGDVEDEHGVTHENAMWLMWMYATPQVVMFDAPEAIAETEATFQSGYYYYTKNADNSFTGQTVTVGDTIPAGTTYYKHVRSGMAGRLRYGSNDWSQSAFRQYLNSNADKGLWWVAQHESDVAPTQATTVPGFLTGYTDEWKAIFQPIKVTTALSTVCDGGVDVDTYDTFFLPSLEQMYGSPQKAGVEGDVWEYWIEETGLSSRSNGSSTNTNDARKIPAITAPSGAAVYCRLRSANRSYTYGVWSVATAGYLYNSSASNAYRAQPACAIY